MSHIENASEIINNAFETIENIDEECCGGKNEVKEIEAHKIEINGDCHCEEKRRTCKCQLTPKEEECRSPEEYEGFHKWKCMMLLIVLVIVICWIIIFTSLYASGTI